MEDYIETITLLDKLSKKDKRYIHFALIALMEQGKIDFPELSSAYVEALEKDRADKNNLLIEAGTCIMESFFDNKVKEDDDNHKHRKHSDWMHTQRCLYFLNQKNMFNMKKMNEDFNYDEEKAKKLSWYERNKGIE